MQIEAVCQSISYWQNIRALIICDYFQLSLEQLDGTSPHVACKQRWQRTLVVNKNNTQQQEPELQWYRKGAGVPVKEQN